MYRFKNVLVCILVHSCFFFFKADIVLISPEYHFDGSYNVSMMQQSAPFLLHFPGAKWLKRGADVLPSPSVEVKNAWLPHCSLAQYVGVPFPFTYSLYLGKEILGCQMVSLFLMLKGQVSLPGRVSPSLRASSISRPARPCCCM